MIPPIPVLSRYGVSPQNGFLPDVLPLSRLPDPYYNKWEAVATNLQALILSRRLRAVVERLPVLSTIGLEHDAEWRRAYSLLCFIAHGYIWAGDVPADRLPPPLAIPLLSVSARLEVPPVATYAGLVLWNFKPLFMDEDIDNLENLATLTTFTGSLDESWFYLVSTAMEARGGPIIPLMLAAIGAAREGDAATVTRCLQSFAERLDDLGALLGRMHESCNPTVFYHRIRPFLAGSKNMADAGLPHGVVYDDGSGNAEYREYSGGSNAQSSLIQFFDIVLGIEHRPTGEKKPRARPAEPLSEAELSEHEGGAGPPPKHNFLMEMRDYMPGPHARFLRDVACVANIREFVDSRPDDGELCLAYDACLAMLRALRDRHIAIVTRYIVVPSREVRARSRSRSPGAVRQAQAQAAYPRRPAPVNLATASSTPRGQSGRDAAGPAQAQRKKSLKGTGGTALIAFLKQARDETGEPAVEEWTRRFVARGGIPSGMGQGDFFLGKAEEELLPETPGAATAAGGQTEEIEVKGLAGTWTIEDEIGGICQY